MYIHTIIGDGTHLRLLIMCSHRLHAKQKEIAVQSNTPLLFNHTISKWFYSIMTSPSPSLSSHYVDEHLPPSVTQQLEAAAFRSLCAHLKERSDSVPNIDLMTVSGFCRNCLAKVRQRSTISSKCCATK